MKCSTVALSDTRVLLVCLQAMFSLCMLESEADEVTLQGVTSVGLKHALDFAYTGQVSLEPTWPPLRLSKRLACRERLTLIRVCGRFKPRSPG